MPSIQLNVKFKNLSSYSAAGSGYQLLSPAEFKELYLWGLPLCNPYTGQTISDAVIAQKLAAAQGIVERGLDLKLMMQPMYEVKDFIREEFFQWGYLKTSYFIRDICKLTGRFNQTKIIDYPYDWLVLRRSNDGLWNNNLYIVPNGNSSVTFSYYAVSYPNLLGFFGLGNIPNYWYIRYITGFDVIPAELLELVGLATALFVLPILELSVTGQGGAAFGMASQSLGLDGLSQSTSKMNGGNIFKERMKLYGEQLRQLTLQMRNIYSGIKFDVC